MANGRSLVGFLSSPAANPTLFQASIENREPTIAAPMAVTATVTPPVAQKLAPKLAVRAAALRPIVRPRRIRAASAAVLVIVKDVCTIVAVRTPRTLIQVSRTIDRIANRR